MEQDTKFIKHKITFNSEGTNCHGNFYLPNNLENLPCIVFANGFSGTMDWILPKFAEHFVQAGFAVLIFDYRFLGESEGEPRQLISLKKQRTDLRNALKWVRSQEKIDKKKIALWGTSLGGSHVIDVAANDAEIAVVIGNMPAIDAIKGANVKKKAEAANVSKWGIISATFRLLGAAIVDVIKNGLGLQPRYLKVYGKAGKAFFTDPALAHRFEKVEAGSSTWKNKVAARFLLNPPRYKEGTIERIKAPIFVVISTQDIELNPAFLKEKFSKAADVEIKEYDYGHFDLYHGEAFKQVAADQVNFMKKVFENY